VLDEEADGDDEGDVGAVTRPVLWAAAPRGLLE
jgi:hypothetical protein